MFVPNLTKNVILNTQHIVNLYIDPPRYERTEFVVVSITTSGNSYTMCRGDEEDCEIYLANFCRMY